MLFLPVLSLSLVACDAFRQDTTVFLSKDGDVRLQQPPGAQRSMEFQGRALMQSGWRMIWDGKAVGEGQGIVRLTLPARAADGSALSEVLQLGASRDPDVVASCLSHGLQSGNGMRLSPVTINNHVWTSYSGSDAGMSQSIKANNYRLVFEQTCYAMDRISYAVRAAKAAEDALTEAEAARLMDAALASVEILPVARR
ncbi:hypothetical protein [uncultured Oxalicibacterium sp.]|uniref:hypothetical protein n=1 Tax=uncultured Oxalicibacterium sp. TaxID=1168540 RepID=UPI0025FE8BB2|nr:hypothetical protein [uncultured Oxalicibacterium sp.]